MLLLTLSAICLVFVLNGLRPVSFTPLMIPSFFAAWLVVELAPQLLVLTVVGVALTALLGGFSWIGLGLALLAAAGLVRMVIESLQVEAAADVALQQWPAIGPAEPHVASVVRRFFRPMAFKDAQVQRTRNLPYGEAGKRNHLDVYRRADHPTGCPTLVQVHGGGWVIGDKDHQGRPLMLEMARRGWVCFAPNYRLSPRATFPDHLVDVKRAIAWVREHGAEYGADPGFLVITGGSAGGHLVALTALTQNDREYQPGFEEADTSLQGCVSYYGVYDLEGETETKAHKLRHDRVLSKLVMKTRDPETFRKASPIARVHPGAPPFLVIHGRNDTVVPVQEARLLVERLRASTTNPVVYLELPGTQHAFDVFPSVRSDAVVRAVARFLET
ncbi:MAG: alpha/beta hydrolase fold domain-containing protein, partial [Actinomycetota bacterium]|nr:alpha/beta hydrolase fold domain-containing protein [Actinomycetota bacterium]